MEAQIIELEKKYWQGMESHNFETVKSLTHFPCIVAGKKGVQSIDEPTFRNMFESGGGDKIRVVSMANFQTQVFRESAVIGMKLNWESQATANRQ